MLKRLAIIMAAMSLALLGLAGSASAKTESTLGCFNHAWVHRDSGTQQGNYDRVAIHNGPHADCTVIYTTPQVATFVLDCYVFNESDNTWTHIALWNGSGWIRGWVYDLNLDGGGSLIPCN
jgi:hypothetical protein